MARWVSCGCNDIVDVLYKDPCVIQLVYDLGRYNMGEGWDARDVVDSWEISKVDKRPQGRTHMSLSIIFPLEG